MRDALIVETKGGKTPKPRRRGADPRERGTREDMGGRKEGRVSDSSVYLYVYF